MIRAAGVKWDIRKDEPYSSYDKFDFEVPTRTENDVYARYRVRLEEMRQSARIIKQALEGMPEGAWQADAPQDRAARARKDEDADGSADLSFQDRDRRLPRAGRRSVPGRGVAARRDRILRRERRHVQAVPRVHAHAELRQSASACRRCWKAVCWPIPSRARAAWISCWEIRTANDVFAGTGSQIREVAGKLSAGPDALGGGADAALRAGRGRPHFA